MRQRTIDKTIEIVGVGRYFGKDSKIVLNPSKINTGIIFRFFERDKDGNIMDSFILPATFNNVVDTKFCTIISEGTFTVVAIEHLMSALWACDIGNVIIDIYNSKQEIPVLDGSSIEFVEKIKEAGIRDLIVERKYIKVLKTVEVKSNGNSFIKIEPSDDFSIDLTLNISNNKQHFYFNGNKDVYLSEISKARTRYTKKDVERNALTTDEVLLLDKGVNIDYNNLRYTDEFVRHDVLDCIGDIFTSGYFMNAKITAVDTCHALNNKLLRELFKNKENYSII